MSVVKRRCTRSETQIYVTHACRFMIAVTITYMNDNFNMGLTWLRLWVRFPSGTQNFSLSHARVIVEKDHLHYLSPSLKFTIFLIYYTLDDFDIADPSSMQDACHMST